jgi:hypothetical protein
MPFGTDPVTQWLILTGILALTSLVSVFGILALGKEPE